MRVVFVWAPLIIFMHLALIAGAVYVLTALPIRLFGFESYINITRTIGSALVGIVIVVFILSKIPSLPKQRVEDFEESILVKPLFSKEPEEEKPPSRWKKFWIFVGEFFGLIIDWVIAMKQKVCPEIRFISEERRVSRG